MDISKSEFEYELDGTMYMMVVGISPNFPRSVQLGWDLQGQKKLIGTNHSPEE